MTDWAIPQIDLDACTRCGNCVQRCPTSAVEMGPDGPFIARPADCTYCALCEPICPEGAIAVRYEIVWATRE